MLRRSNPFTREIICPRKRHGTARGRPIKIRMERSIGKHLSSTRTTRCWPEVEASKGSFVVGPFAEQLLFHRSVQRLSDTARYILFDARKSRGFSRLFESPKEEGKASRFLGIQSARPIEPDNRVIRIASCTAQRLSRLWG